MGELPLKELVSRLQAGTPFHEIKDIRQTAYLADTVEPLPEDINLFSHEECLHDKLKQAKNFKHIEEESNKQQASRILQKGRQTDDSRQSSFPAYDGRRDRCVIRPALHPPAPS